MRDPVKRAEAVRTVRALPKHSASPSAARPNRSCPGPRAIGRRFSGSHGVLSGILLPASLLSEAREESVPNEENPDVTRSSPAR